ncbi:MAG: hypothetical protein JJ863_30455 [Deltaproteobacteria bacterium]|nr:hypothetical protein [Deltaproteobacteria bacterium]
MRLFQFALLTLFVAIGSGCGETADETECERLFAEDRGCIADRYGSVATCEGAHDEALTAGCGFELMAHDDCLVGQSPDTDACMECVSETDALLACGLPDDDPCAELYFELDEGCLDRTYEGDYAYCREVFTSSVYEPCRELFETAARCLAAIPFVDADSCTESCNDEDLAYSLCATDATGG